jgi:Rieske 2Fe-2S family protein
MNTTFPTLRPTSDEYTGPPKEWYLGQEWHERDIEAIFRGRWLLAGHVDELEAGAKGHGYLTFSLGGEEVLIRSSEDGEVCAYHNVCPHRGAQLCEGRSGRTLSSRIVCPYHAWTFSVSDGKLLSARHMHDDFDLAAIGLKPVKVEVWKGLIFVCLSEEAPPPLPEYFADVTFGGYEFEAMKLATAKSHEIEANWKIVVENNVECYHCAVIHPELVDVYDWRITAEPDIEGAMRSRAEGLEVIEAVQESPFTIKGESVCAIPSPRSDGEAEPPTHAIAWEPGVVVSVSRDFAWLFVPKPLGPTRTELRQYWLVAKDAEEGRDYELENLKLFWDTTMHQDRGICEAVQRGIQMPAYTPGPLNRIHQIGQAGFYAWYMEQIRQTFPECVVEGKS